MVRNKGKQKRVLLPTLLVAFGAPLLTSAAAISASILVTPNETERDIPEEFLRTSLDGTILLGFQDNVRLDDLTRYNTLKIPENITTIGSFSFPYAFKNGLCYINKIIFNEKLTTIGSSAFYGCTAIKETNIDQLSNEGKCHISYIGDSAFGKSGVSYIFTIPESVKHIGKRAFADCNNLTQVVFSNGLEEVGEFAFSGCWNLASLDFEGLTKIPTWLKKANNIFYEIGSEVKYSREAKIKLINDDQEDWEYCLFELQKLPQTPSSTYSYLVIVTNALPDRYLKYEDEDKGTLIGFSDDFDTSTLWQYSIIRIPQVEIIRKDAFKNKITNCRIQIEGKETTTIEESAFEGCNGLIGQPSFPKVETIGKRAFYGCEKITSFIYPSTLKDIGESSFESCKSLDAILFNPFSGGEEEEEQKIQNNAFRNCTNLALIDVANYGDIQFPDWGEQSGVFTGVNKTGIINIGTECTKIQDWTNIFAKLGLDGVNQSEGYSESQHWYIHRIDKPVEFSSQSYETFRQGTILHGLTQTGRTFKNEQTTLHIDTKVQYIYPDAFKDEFVLTMVKEKYHYWDVIFSTELREIGDAAFKNCDGLLCDLSLPYNLTYIGNEAFYNCSRLRGQLHLPENIQHIGDHAFDKCYLLTVDKINLSNEFEHLGATAFGGVSINSVSFGSGIQHLGDRALSGIKGLTEIDFSRCNLQSISSIYYEPHSLTVDQATGTIYVPQCSDEELADWAELFKTNMGLPNTWTVARKGAQ